MSEAKDWIHGLSDEDLAFIRRFVLASGSLKEMASTYNVSYPTIRLRLDRLIGKIELLTEDAVTSEFERALRLEVADGHLDLATMGRLLNAYQREREGGS